MYTGFAIALAWPETLCKQAGAWYDGLTSFLGFSKNHYYKVGHAAVVLIESNTGNCHYFDFGRYHAPFGYGRVRDAETDHDLGIHIKALISDVGEIANMEEILSELYGNPACHGQGQLLASYTKINFEKSYSRAKQMQEKNPWKYGPFIWKGTNCSRFVRTIVLAGNPIFLSKLKLFFPLATTPTPMGNVNSLKNKIKFPGTGHSIIQNSCLNNSTCNVSPTFTAH